MQIPHSIECITVICPAASYKYENMYTLKYLCDKENIKFLWINSTNGCHHCKMIGIQLKNLLTIIPFFIYTIMCIHLYTFLMMFMVHKINS